MFLIDYITTVTEILLFTKSNLIVNPQTKQPPFPQLKLCFFIQSKKQELVDLFLQSL